MKTTTLFAELIVVGTGAAIFLLLLCYAVFGVPCWFVDFFNLSTAKSVTFLVPILSFIYMLGIVINNLSHLIFKVFENRLQQKMLGETDRYKRLRNQIYTSPGHKEMVDDFEFRRTKVRICRGWFLNSLLISILLVIIALNNSGFSKVIIFWTVIFFFLSIALCVSWAATVNSELERLLNLDEIADKED